MELEHAVSNMIWEGSPVVVRNSSFPEVRGRTRQPWEIATTIGPTGNQEIDPVVLRSVGSMDGRE